MQNDILIRDYQSADKEAVLQLLRLNTPGYFSPEEEQDLIYYLDHELEYYFVLEYNEKIVGCGGINFSGDPGTGKISWDIFHPEYQGKSLGSTLLNYRIEKLKTFKDLQTIIVRTSQMAFKFYEKNGFLLEEVKKDYWAPGFDLYKMKYKEAI